MDELLCFHNPKTAVIIKLETWLDLSDRRENSSCCCLSKLGGFPTFRAKSGTVQDEIIIIFCLQGFYLVPHLGTAEMWHRKKHLGCWLFPAHSLKIHIQVLSSYLFKVEFLIHLVNGVLFI